MVVSLATTIVLQRKLFLQNSLPRVLATLTSCHGKHMVTIWPVSTDFSLLQTIPNKKRNSIKPSLPRRTVANGSQKASLFQPPR